MTVERERLPSKPPSLDHSHGLVPEDDGKGRDRAEGARTDGAQLPDNAVGRVIKNSLLLSLQPFALHLLSLFATAFIARKLGSEDFGRFNLALSFIAMASVLTNPGLRSVTVRRIAQGREEPAKLVGQMLVLRAILAFCALLLLFGALPFLGASASTKHVTAILAVTVVIAAANTVFIDSFQGLERMGPVVRANFIGGFLLTVTSIIVLVMGGSLFALAFAYVLGPLVTLSLLSYDAFRTGLAPSFRWKAEQFKSLLHEGRSFFGLGAIYLLVQRLDMVVLARILGDGAVGSYAAASQLIARVGVLTDGVTTAVAPAAYRLSLDSDGASKSLLRKAMTWLITLMLVFALGGTVLGDFVVGLVFGDQFGDAAQIVAILAWMLPFFAMTGLLHQTLFVKNRQNDVLRVELRVQVVGVALLLVGTIVGYGVGSAIAKVAGAALSTFAILFVYRKELKPTIPFDAVGRILGFAAVLLTGYLCLRWVDGHPLLVGSAILVHTGGALYMAGRLNLIPLSLPKGLAPSKPVPSTTLS